MTYETVIKAYKGIPFQYSLRKRGYYDIKGVLVGGNNASSVDFSVYSGLNMNYYQGTDSLMTVTASNGDLPDGSLTTGTFGCLAEVGAGSGSYTNFTKVGTPTVNVGTGETTGFTTSNYLKLPQSFPTNVKFKAIFNVTYKRNTVNTDGQALFTQDIQNKSFYVQYASSLFGIWDGTNGFMSSTVLVDNTKYWIGMDYDYSTKAFKFYLLIDDGTYDIDTLPDFSNWSEEINATLTSDIFSNTLFRIGSNPQNNYIWRGNVDLSGCRIYINDETWWTPTVGTDYAVKREGYVNYTKIGSPTINFDTGEVSGFSSSNYLKLPTAFNPGLETWELRFKFKTGSTVSTNQKFFHSCKGTGFDGRFGTGAQIYNSKFNMFVSSDGSSWLFDEVGTYTPLANTTYWVKVGWDGEEYYFDYSTDGETYTRDITYSSASSICTMANSYIGIYSTSSFEGPWLGTIYLANSSIYINNNEFWNSLGEYDTFVPGLLPSGVIDDGSAQIWNLFYNNGDYRLNTTSTMTGYTWVGSVAIPAHSSPTPAPTPALIRVYNNFTKVGSPIVDQQTGILSDCSLSNYIQTKSNFIPQNNPWEFGIKFTTSDDVNETQYFISDTQIGRGSVIGISEEVLVWYASSTGENNWDILDGVAGHTILDTNTTYWAKFIFTGTRYQAYLSTTGEFAGEETLEIDEVNSTLVYGDYRITYGAQVTDSIGVFFPWLGTIDLSETYVRLNGNDWWVPYEEFTPKLYNNFITVGSPIVNQLTGVVSGFSLNDYISLNNDFPSNHTSYEIDIKVITPSSWEDGDYPVIDFDGSDIFLEGQTDTFCQWNGETKVSGSTIIQPNTEYVLKLVYDGSDYKFYVNNSLEYTTNYNLDSPVLLRIGSRQEVQYWPGSIDLSESYIKIDGNDWWVGYTELTPRPSIVYNNFSTVGSPVVNQSTGIVSGFDPDNYLKLPQVFNPSSNTWEMMFKVTTGDDLGESRWICGTSIAGQDWQGLTLGYEPDKTICFYLSSNGEEWDIALHETGQTELTTNTLYYFKLQFTGTQYILSSSLDGINWSQECAVTSSTPIYVSQQPLGIGVNLWNNEYNNTWWQGSIDLSESYIKINGQTWWVGYIGYN